jgi:transaldolase
MPSRRPGLKQSLHLGALLDFMTTEKTAEGIRNFGKDIVKPEKLIEAGL